MKVINMLSIVSLCVFVFCFIGYADVTPVADRTPVVRDAIVKAIEGVDAAVDVTDAQLTSITVLNLRNKDISELKAGDFSGLTGLVDLNLYGNKLSSLPAGIFEGLTALTTIRLGRNSVNPLPFTVSLEKVAAGEFKAVAPAGALFDIVLPVTVAKGSLTGSVTTLTISKGSVESGTLSVTRTPGTTDAVTVTIGTLPSLPKRNHYGYTLVKSESLPLAVISRVNTAPTFTDGTTVTRTVAENTDTDINIGTPVAATDTENDTLTYTLSGTDADTFDIDSTTGQLKTKAALDYETKNSYAVVVTVSDGIASDSITVSIAVSDIDENRAPLFSEGDPTTRSVVENTDAGENIGEAVAATDADNDTLTYSLSGTDAADFALNAATGQLKTKAALDYETKNSYAVVVTVSDGTASDSITVSIAVSDIIDENRAPLFSEGDATTRSVVENIKAGKNIGEAVAATDADNDTLTYSLSGTDAADFALNAATGQLKTKAALDYETKNSYAVVVTVSDGIASDSITVSIAVSDIDENRAPLFSEGDPTTRSVVENTDAGENIGEAVTATDADNDTLTYSLSGTDAATFALNAATGQLKTKAALDYETKNSYSVVVTVSDGIASNSITVSIAVSDINENRAPVFSEGEGTTRSVIENTDAGKNIGEAVTATDADNDTLTYSLSGTDAADFALNAATGQLKTKAALDYETKNSYAVVVTVSDGIASDSITVSIAVSDIDENRAPLFSEGEDTTRSVVENINAGENIGEAVTATDADDDTLTYSLSGTDAATFALNAATGQLKTKAALDYETKNSYAVVVTVSDGIASDSITVSIAVSDIDENRAPLFSEGDPTTRSVVENTDAGENIGEAVTATDADNDTLTYSLSGTDAATFALNAATGQLKTKAALDYETKNSYAVVVTVSDGIASDSITVSIVVSDIDENRAPVFSEGEDKQPQTANNPPVFAEGESTTRNVLEGTTSGVDIGAAVAATDADGHTLTYTLGGTDAAAFSINSTNGQLRTEAALDYDTKSTYTVTITASDGTDTATIAVTINVADATENSAPAFTAGTSTTRSVAENTGSGVDIGEPVSATDADNDNLTYTLGGTDASAFSIDSTNGQLRTEASLDYEIDTSYTVTITVSDGNAGSDSITVTINVTDVEEAPENNPPAFDGDETTRTVAENSDADANIGATITATDADDDDLTYSLGGTDAASFSIDSTTGQLKTKAALDFETKKSYTVTVIATDGTLTDSITVTINVTDVNEAPVFSDGESTTREIAENVPEDINIGSAVAATDPEENKLTYTLGGTNAAAFSIDAATGQLKTKAALDFEDKDSYSVTITVSDGNLTDKITVTINVTDLEETESNTPPVFEDGTSTTRSVAENTESDENIGTPIAATDADENVLAYLLSGTDAASFGIDSKIGQLKTNAALNHETKAEYAVTITVTDGSGTDTISVTINVTDVNEAPVIASDTAATRSVPENTRPGTNIGSAVAATDPDDDDLTYRLGGTDAVSFDIDSTNGQLKTKAALDYEDKNSYSVTITVSDGTLTDTIDITINVTNIDENRAPVFSDGASTTRSVAENTVSGQDIGSPVAATDADEDTLTYTLGGTDADSFSIVSSSGQLRTKADLDYEDKDSYSVAVSVSDGKGGSDSITVTINVTDVQENRDPVFSDGASTTRSIPENTGSGQDIGTAVGATDADTGDTLTYSLGGTDESSFSINSTTGQLRTKAALDFENKNRYEVTVSVSDGKGGSASVTVTINVTDVQENRAPVFTEGTTATRSIPENTGSGQNIGTAVGATDADEDTLTYSLGGTDSTSFDIVTSSGQLQTKAALDFENKSSYEVTVSVSDGRDGSDSITVTINVTNVDETQPNNAPVFTDGASTTRSIPENTGSGQNIGTAVGATDADNGDTLTYSLGGTDSTSFDIVTSSGQLQTKAALDFENKSSYEVTVSVSDGRDGSDSITVTINVTNVDETQPNNAPVFTDGASTTRSIPENTGSGQNIGTAVGATDADNGDTLTYSLGGTDSASFDIVTSSGQLQTKAALDFENKSSYEVTVSVSDGRGGSDSITVTINVTNVDETQPNNAPVFTDGTSTTRSVAENTGSGQNIGTAVGATDADEDTLTYSLGGTDSASFDIVTSSGQLQTKAALDFENKSSYEVTVSVSDGRGGSDSITVTISVTNVDETLTLTITAVSDRSRKVRNTIVRAVPGIRNARNVTEAHLAAITTLSVSMGEDDELQAGDFDGLTGLTSLTLYDTWFETLPSGIFDQLTLLTSLNLGASAFDTLPSGIFDKLTSLTSLDLSGGLFETLPSGIFDKLTSLTSLDLSVGNFLTLPSGIFDKLTSLTSLDLSEGSFDLSSGIFDKLTSLTSLDLSDGLIATLPANVFDKLTALTSLDLSDNVLASLPSGIFDKLTALTSLDLSTNSFNTLPSGIFDKLTALTSLDLHSNNIDDLIPSGIFDKLTALTTLDLSNCWFQTIRSGDLDKLTKLTTLDLSSNIISVLPTGIFDRLTVLTTLDLSENSLSLVPADFFDNLSVTPNLTGTNLEPTVTPVSDRSKTVKNAIVKAVPRVSKARNVTTEHLAAITSLTVLMGEDDELQAGDFDGLTGLTSLTLYDTWFETLPSGIFDQLTSLTSLNLGAGLFDTLPSGIFDRLTKLTSLDLSDGSFDLSSGVFDKLTKLTSLDLSVGAFDTLPSGIFDKLTKLTSLDLSEGSFDLSSGIFDKLTSLTSLDLSDGFLDTLPANVFDKLTKLTSLDLSNNNLESLPSGIFDRLTALTTLDLSGNTLSQVPADFFNNLSVTPNLTDTNLDPGGAPQHSPVVPKSTSLFANYPNPFNPETWIPYQLAKPTKVTLTIYDMQGRVVRKLDLGLKPAGVYISRTRAAHWDGRNNFGEQVAAGLYFYTFTAGDFTSTRKMLILK